MDWQPEIDALLRLGRRLLILYIFVWAERTAVQQIRMLYPNSPDFEVFLHGVDWLTIIGSLIWLTFDWLELLRDRWDDFINRRGD